MKMLKMKSVAIIFVFIYVSMNLPVVQGIIFYIYSSIFRYSFSVLVYATKIYSVARRPTFHFHTELLNALRRQYCFQEVPIPVQR